MYNPRLHRFRDTANDRRSGLTRGEEHTEEPQWPTTSRHTTGRHTTTPQLCASVSAAGGLGFLAAGYLSAAGLAERIDATRRLTSRAFGVNLFVPAPAGDPAAVAAYARRIEPEAEKIGVALGEPRAGDDDWSAKIELLAAAPVPLVSFTFGCPPDKVIDGLHQAGSEVWVTVTSAAEARLAQGAGVDGLVVQGLEAGGHRGGFADVDDATGLLALLQLVRGVADLPLIGAGGIMTGAGLAAFLRCPEAGTTAVHRQALLGTERPTRLTRAFTGRLARGVPNRFLDEYSAVAPSAYPQVHHLTAPLRAHGRSTGDGDLVSFWAGQAYPLVTDLP